MFTRNPGKGRLTKLIAGVFVALFAYVAVAQAIVEQEPNNYRGEANGPIQAGDTWTGTMGEGYDSEWIKFYVAQPNTKVSFDVTRGVLLQYEAGFEIVMANGDGVPSHGYVTLPDGVASGSMSAILPTPGKYFVWVTGLVARQSTGLTWEVKPTEGTFATFSQLEANCAASKAKLPGLTKAVAAAQKALAKAKKLKRGKAAAVKKAKARLAKAQKAYKAAKAASDAACAVEE